MLTGDCKNFIMLCCLSSIILVSPVLFPPNSVLGDEPNGKVFPKDSAPYGIKYSDWLAEWRTWLQSIPQDQNPRSNYTSSKCSIGQNGPVWFLADQGQGYSTQVRYCDVPAKKAIMFNILGGVCNASNTPGGDEGLLKCAKEGNGYENPNYAVIGASIDGVEVKNPKNYNVTSDFFNVTNPENNIYGEQPGIYRAVTSGYALILKPLPVGNHTIIFFDNVQYEPPNTGYNRATKTIYHLNVLLPK